MPVRNGGSVVGVLPFGRWSGVLPRALGVGDHRSGDRAGFAAGPVRATNPGQGDSGVVARSDVDPVPGDAGQGGSPVMRHDGGYGGVDAPG
jgi:hypothetical protein